MTFAESDLEETLIAWLRELKWSYVPGPTLAPDGDAPERGSYSGVLLQGRLKSALRRLNPTVPDEGVEDAYRRVLALPGGTIQTQNRAFHRMLADGVRVEYLNAEGRLQGDIVRILDPD